MAKPVDNKAKERKQKIFLAVGGVLLLGLMAFQLPKLMQGSKSPSAAPSAAAPATTTSAGPVVETTSFTATKETLASFTFFKSKDPFVAVVSDQAASTAPSQSTAGPPATATPSVSSTPAAGPVFGTVDGPATFTHAASKPGKAQQLPGAVIKLNGTKIRVALGDTFPKNQPVFRLAGIKAGGVRIALVKGGLADGTSAITVPKRHPLTLVNTADNKRWTIVVLSATKGT